MSIRNIGFRSWRWSAVLCGALTACAVEKPEPGQEPLQDLEQQAQKLSPPAGCTEITMGALANGIQLSPVMYGGQPTYQGTFSAFGNPAVADTANIRLDVNTAPGLYDLAAGGANLFTCEQCVYGYQDAGTTEQKLFVASSGSLLLALKVSPQQTVGALTNVTLRESVAAPPLSAPYKGSAVVAGGECKWIRFATWSTARLGGCDPRQGSLTASLPGQTCVAVNYAADDGTLERSQGTKTQGEACTYTPAAVSGDLATTDCAQGYACSDTVTEARQCLAACDPMAAVPGCPSGTVCGVYGLCIEQSVLEPIGFAFDPALIGETCSVGFAEFCGTEGARGACVNLGSTGHGTCLRYARARSECGAGEELGFIGYPLSGGGYDRTTGWCYPDGL
ncbi:hypothetical protein POL68_28170 [Stigmatella sp. ncwal1]|uniref:Lipoprotein n=1 Tax=Stigmatella ashevillensis TaxID=2995309 RepID=A0ABT5DFF8_9BACT|nr:hypothetical protein [Stigmatella ashevillena]MDC0712372.1 hypothetical protein [Stigmatella ashevillena]